MQAQYKTYDSYKDSGTEWLGMIPSSWELQSIRAVTELKSQKNQPDLQVLSVYREYGVIQKDSRDDNHNVTSEDTSNYKAVAPGDLVVNKMKAWQGSMGVSEHHGIVSPAYITCKTKSEKVLPRFLHYLLRSQPFISVYNALSYGVRIGQWDMHYEDFKKIALAYPSITEQERIVAFLDQKTAEINAAIEKKQRLIELLKEQKSILINQAVTKGLNPSAPMKDSGIEWIGQIPAHWEVKKLKYAVSINSESLPENTDPRLEFEYIDIGNVTFENGVTETERYNFKTAPSRARRTVKAGDVIVSTVRTYLRAIAQINEQQKNCIVSTGFAVMRPTPELVSSFLGYIAKSEPFVQQVAYYSKGMSYPAINSTDLGAVLVPIPPATEQEVLAETLDKQISNILAVWSETTKQIEKLQEFKQTLIAHAVTGKIKV